MAAGTTRSPNISLINRRRSRSAASWSSHDSCNRQWPSLGYGVKASLAALGAAFLAALGAAFLAALGAARP
jgi:hypothetical protein